MGGLRGLLARLSRLLCNRPRIFVENIRPILWVLWGEDGAFGTIFAPPKLVGRRGSGRVRELLTPLSDDRSFGIAESEKNCSRMRVGITSAERSFPD